MNEKFKDTDLREALRRNYANVPQLPASSLTPNPSPGRGEEGKYISLRNNSGIISLLRGEGTVVRLLGIPIAASILIAFLLWPKGDEAPITQPEIQQPVVAKAFPVPSQGGVNIAEAHESQPQQQPHKPQQPAAEAQPSPSGEQGEGLERLEENLPLLAEADITPLPERATGVFRGTTECGSGPTKGSELPIRDGGRQGESPLDEILPPERQALVDIYLAEEALQVAYKQQEQTQELRAFSARLQGKEPETSHLITAF